MSLTDLIAENVGVAVVCLLAIFIAVWQLGHLSALWCKKSSFSLLNKHILITGGSQGLGRALAVECARQGAKVTIVARNPNVLNEAKEFITNAAKATPHTPLKSETSVFTASADVTNEAQVQSAMDAAEKANGPIDMLITCAGSAVTGHLMKVSTADHRRSMELNYFGTLNAVRACIPRMIERRSGHIVLVSSGMALTAYTGYSTYAPTKFAIRGLGECLRSEMLPHNIQIYQAYPPGFQSPGFDQENLTKPADTKAIEAGEPVHTAEDVASCIVDSVRKGEYHISCGNFGINLLTRLAVGISPRNNTLADFLLAPFLVLIGKVYTSLWDSTVLSERAKMDKAEKADKSQ